MGRLFTCGFENQDVLTTGANNREWSYIVDGSALSISTSVKRSGSASLRINQVSNEMNMYHTLTSYPTEIYFRFYIYIVSLPSSNMELMRTYTSSSVYASRLRLNTDGSIDLQGRVGTTLTKMGSSSPVLALNTWHCLEGYVKVNATTWNYAARLNYTEFASGSDASQSSTTLSRFYLISDTYDCEYYIDDMAINDAAGSYQNSYPGNGHVVHLRPNAAGDNNNCSSGDYTSIDEITPDDATSYAIFDANNDILDVNIESPLDKGIGISDKIPVVIVAGRYIGADTSGVIFNFRLKSQASGTVLSSASITASASYWVTNPPTYGIISYVDTQAGGPWTTNLLEETQIGVLCSDATPDLWLTQLYLIVEYAGIKTINETVLPSIKTINGMSTSITKTTNSLTM